MNIYALPSLITNVLIFSIGLFVFFRNRSQKTNIMFGLFSLSLFIWLFGFTAMYLSHNETSALFWARFGFLGITFIPIFAYHFIVTFLEQKPPRWFIISLYVSTIPAIILSRTNYVYNGVAKYFWGYYPTAGSLYFIFLSIFVFLFCYGIILLYSALKEESKKNYPRAQRIKQVYS